MAKEHRFERRILGKLLDDLITKTPKNEKKARITSSTPGVTYVFLVCPKALDRDTRRSELGIRCYVMSKREQSFDEYPVSSLDSSDNL